MRYASQVIEDLEERWIRRWLWALVAFAVLAYALPELSISSLTGEATKSEPDPDLLPTAIRALPLLWAVLAVIATRASWGTRCGFLTIGLLVPSLMYTVSRIDVAARFQLPMESTFPEVLRDARDLVGWIGLGVVPAAAHGARRQRPGRHFRWMAVGASACVLVIAHHRFERSTADWHAAVWAVQSAGWAYVSIALVSGLHSSDAGRRAITGMSRAALIVAFVHTIPWDDDKITKYTPIQFLVVTSLKNGAHLVAHALVAALAAASWFERHARRADRHDLNVFS